MDILVCIKQVPSVSHVKIDRETNNIIREGVPSIINPADRHALEEALKLKDQFGAHITVITMGAPDAEKSLKKCLAVGADKAYLVSDRAFAGSDTLATSYTLSSAIKYLGNFDVVFTGSYATDGDTGQVGPEIAEMLDYSLITYVNKIEATEKSLVGYRETNNVIEKVESSYPVVVSVTRNASEPRKPAIGTDMSALKIEELVLNAQIIGAKEERIGKQGSPTVVSSVFAPPLLDKGMRIEEATEEASVKKLMELLISEKLVG